METIGQQQLWVFRDGINDAVSIQKRAFRKEKAHYVASYLDLAKKVAELQFKNRDYVLLFRGQRHDIRNLQKFTTLKPSLFRPRSGSRRNPDQEILTNRFDRLRAAERVLLQRYKGAALLGIERLERYQILRWAILQHYEVCATPLLDVTQSLRVAASFASLGANEEAFIFVIGVPNISGAITASAEAGLQVIRLSSVCPPAALRPHLQEGYLLGEYPEMSGYDQKELYKHFEIDFGRRLVTKFRFDPDKFWKHSGSFPAVARRALYPSESSDPLYSICLGVKSAIDI
ncbi:MAG: FRG domain-containing protein [Chthoniobacterales bacterium]